MKQFLPDKSSGTSKLFNRKILLIMRLTVCLIILCVFGVKAAGYAQKVSINAKNESLAQVSEIIKKQTGFFFLYDANEASKRGKITVSAKDKDLKEVLQEISEQLNLSYKIIDKTIILSNEKNANAQDEIIVKGIVRSNEAAGKPAQALPGVVVRIKGTNKAVNTAADGTFFIKAPASATLVFSIIGYAAKEVAIAGKKVIEVNLEEMAGNLQEIIITAYGTKEVKESQVGSAQQLTRKDLERRPLSRVDQLLDGVVPGVIVQVQDNSTSSIRPRYQTRIRGESSLGASSDPLWVIDGVPMYTGDETNMITGTNTSISPLTYINPDDIESITVLKDATATSIYGANGSNGVVLINTIRGKVGSDNINYSFRTGVNLLRDNKFNVLSASEYRELVGESFANNTQLAINPVIDNGGNTNWYDVFYRNGVTTQHNITFTGGSKKTSYYVSGAYFNEKPIEIANSTKRFTSRINLDQRISDRFNLFFRMGNAYVINNMFNPGDSYYTNRPIDSPFDSNGNYVLKFYNKLADAVYNDDVQKTMSTYANIGATLVIIPGLSYTTLNGIDYISTVETDYDSMKTFSGSLSNGSAYRGQTTNFKWNSQHRFNFEKNFGRNAISAVIGGEALATERKSVSASGYGFANDNVREVTYAVNRSGSSSGSDQSQLSYFGQVNYSWNKKYNVVGVFRGDGNSDFGSDVQWAFFKSIGASWVISDEDFWNIEAIKHAKLKFSAGTNGNSRIGAYKAKGVYSFSSGNNYNGQSGAVMSSGENSGLTWETTYMYNLGLSLNLFKRISLEAEAYYNKTVDLLDDVYVTNTTGFNEVTQNVGSLRNSGLEVSINTDNIKNSNFSWTTSLNFSINRNKILKLYNDVERRLDTRIIRVGEDTKTNYLIRWAGVDPRDGGPLWYDARGNITKTFDLNNRVIAGRQTPDFFGGMTNTFSYKNFSLRGLFQYTVGGYAFSSLQRNSESDGRNLATDNQSRNQLDRWREPGDLTLVPKTILNENADNGRNSTRFLHSKTAFRLSNVSLNYAFTEKLAKKLSLQRASVYLQADNVGFWTPYKSKEGYNDYRNYFNAFPQPLVLSFGLNVSL
jgi:TonB-linked SusC/RagA family outer membrane protein